MERSALAKLDNAQGSMEEAAAKVWTSRAQLGRAIAQKKGAKALIAEKETVLKLAEIKHEYCTRKASRMDPIEALRYE